MASKWSAQVAKFRGVPIHVHANTLLGLFMLSGFRFDPIWWCCALAIILLHELGHALVVKWVGGKPTEVMIHGFGGYCAWVGEVSPVGRAAIACGGVAAQLVLLGVALSLHALGLIPQDPVSAEVFGALTYSNAWLIGLNLLPIAPLDGAEAWAFPYRLGQMARLRLTTYRNVLARDGYLAPVGSGGVKEQAKNLAAQMLEEARKGEGE